MLLNRPPQSEERYHLSLYISYPNEADRERARASGVDPGGDIMIHGLKPGFAHPGTDWTQGCIAVTNEATEEIWHLVGEGTVIEIVP